MFGLFCFHFEYLSVACVCKQLFERIALLHPAYKANLIVIKVFTSQTKDEGGRAEYDSDIWGIDYVNSLMFTRDLFAEIRDHL